jgi:DNA replication and repair protein RecF
LIRQGINLTYGRLKYLDLIRKYACEIYRDLSGGESLQIVYNSNIFTDSIDFDNREQLYEVYKNCLNSINSEGQSSKTPGAHKDDVLFIIDGNNARTYASQGQLRSVAVSLKLAEAQIIRDYNRENSVVLLDEVLGELDESRRQYVIKYFQTGRVLLPCGTQAAAAAFDRSLEHSQVFITSCNTHDFENLPNIRAWSVDNGLPSPRE